MAPRTIAQLAQDLRARRISARELAEQSLSMARRLSGLNAFITLDASAVERAACGTEHALAGIPFAHKDIFCTNGVRTTCASRMLEHFMPPYDAAVVERLAKTGAVSIGKTNMDEF